MISELPMIVGLSSGRFSTERFLVWFLLHPFFSWLFWKRVKSREWQQFFFLLSTILKFFFYVSFFKDGPFPVSFSFIFVFSWYCIPVLKNLAASVNWTQIAEQEARALTTRPPPRPWLNFSVWRWKNHYSSFNFNSWQRVLETQLTRWCSAIWKSQRPKIF